MSSMRAAVEVEAVHRLSPICYSVDCFKQLGNMCNKLVISAISFAAMGLAACASEQPTNQVVIDGRTVYVVNAETEQAGHSAAVSACRAGGGSPVFVEIVQFRQKRTSRKAAKFSCTG